MKYACIITLLLTTALAVCMEQEKESELQNSFESLAREWHAVHEEISVTTAALERLSMAVKDMYSMQYIVQKQHTQLHPLTYSHTPPASDRLELCQSGTPHNEMVQKLDQELRLVHCDIAQQILTLPAQQEQLESKLAELVARKQAISCQIEQQLIISRITPSLAERVSAQIHLPQVLSQSMKAVLYSLGYSH